MRTVWQYDERITAPYSGHRDAADYYERSCPGPLLARMEVPVLILAAEDDPIVPVDSLARWALPRR